MEDKKGALWGIYFVFITIFFCLMVVGFYYVQEDNTDSSLVSPRAVLKIQDNLELYEMEESKFIKESLQEVDAKFGTDEFIGEFREIFLGKISSDYSYSSRIDFIFEDLTLNGIDIEVEAKAQKIDFFKNILYPEEKSRFEDGKFVIERAKVGKSFLLTADENTKINFPVEFSYEFGKEYLISFENDEFIVEEI